MRPYIGVPFEEANCWDICRRALLEQKGIALPDFSNRYSRDVDPSLDAAEAALRTELIRQEAATSAWSAVESAAPFDMLIIRTRSAPIHCALVVDAQYALSSRPPVGGHLVAYRSSLVAGRIVGIYRHAALRPPHDASRA